MHSETLPIASLQPHPANSNVMPKRLFGRLVAHIETTGNYPPIIVRPLDDAGDDTTDDQPANGRRYQILDGHHRVRALQQLGQIEARCEIWQVDEAQALVLLATLNRLEGADDPFRRASLLRELEQHMDRSQLARLLPEREKEIESLLALEKQAPMPLPAVPQEQLPVAVYFFLLPAQRDALEAALRATGFSREEALMKLVAP